MGWKCYICVTFIALTLRILMRHICTEHSCTPNFSIKCDLNGCPKVYTKYNSFYRHVIRDHHLLLTDQRPPSHCHYSVEVPNDDAGDFSDNEIMNEIPMETDDEIQQENNTEQIDVDHDNEQRMAVTFLMGLRENHRIRETAADVIAEGANALVQRHVSTIRANVYQILRREGIDPDTINGFSSQFDTLLPFEDLTTGYERTQYIKRNFFYVNPEFVRVGQNIVDNRRRRARDYIVQEENFAYFPMNKSLEQFFQNHRIFEMARNTRIQNDEEFYGGLCSGNVYKTNPVIESDINTLQILLYYDDLEVCNPMSKKAGSHKLGLFYYSIGNLPVTYRSRLPAIRTLAIIKRNVMNKHTINVVIERIKRDMEMLERGHTITLSGTNYLIKGTCLCFIGDNSAAHEFSGFKIAVGFSFKKCRECEVTTENLQTTFNEHDNALRSKENYERSCLEMSQAQTERQKTALSRDSGITHKSAASDIPNFDITKMMPQDIMHVMFEGVGLYEIKAVLRTLVAEGHFTLNRLNAQIENFRYGFRDRGNQPVSIPQKVFTNEDSSLRQSASSMITLMKLLPFMLVEKLSCDPANQYVALLTEICTIALIMLSPVISVETVLMLKVLIEDHLKQFKVLFPNKTIIPKQHYMIHIPSTIERYGSLTNVWSMRFEGKHQFIKQRLSGSNNFKNVVKSVADRCAMYECGLNCSQEHPLFKNDCHFGKCSASADLDHAKDSINAFFGIDIAYIQNVFETSWVIYNGQKFITNECEIAFGESEGLPEFGHLVSVWIVKICDDGDVINEHINFQLKMYETVNYDARVNGYHVDEPTIAQGLVLVHIDNIFVSSALHMYKGTGGKMFIFAPHDLLDVVQSRQSGSGD